MDSIDFALCLRLARGCGQRHRPQISQSSSSSVCACDVVRYMLIVQWPILRFTTTFCHRHRYQTRNATLEIKIEENTHSKSISDHDSVERMVARWHTVHRPLLVTVRKEEKEEGTKEGKGNNKAM